MIKDPGICLAQQCTTIGLDVVSCPAPPARARKEGSGDELVSISSPDTPIFCARPAALSKNRVWTLSLVKLGRNYTNVLACCRTSQVAQAK